MTSNKLVLGLAAVAALALGSCSSEPSDWRDDKKVSVDSVPPGTRESDNFDLATDAPSQHKGGAVAEPISQNHEVPQTLSAGAGKHDVKSAEQATSANAEEAAAGKVDTEHNLGDKPGEVQKEN
ncbi:hypothetical protein LJ737_26135 [Hymenobacter sp. 15J16-1T3B]|uniref:hypothetical protein n=1 Tax=Hymenobacter sp. 15J16-1T3B TaxID=2886941 RepID=UPI001D10757C|nr:hypothetical protein [Hymenobacter sp. 15J16-1T3B]MCC3160743.1 hypothetical protein [Hymenobacter sp. 15J16-1T3B]